MNNLKSRRGTRRQIDVAKYIQDCVDNRIDIGTFSKIENGIILPTVAVLELLCNYYHCTPLDIYNSADIDLVGLGHRLAPKQSKLQQLSNTYNFCVRLNKGACKLLNNDVLHLLGYHNRKHWLNTCLEHLNVEYENLQIKFSGGGNMKINEKSKPLTAEKIQVASAIIAYLISQYHSVGGRIMQECYRNILEDLQTEFLGRVDYVQ